MTQRLVSLTMDAGAHVTDETLHLYGHALEFLEEGVFFTDLRRPDHPVVCANPAFERLTGYTAEELIGRSYGVLRGPENRPDAFAEIKAAFEEKRPWSGELLVGRKDGTLAWHALRLTPTLDATGVPHYCIGVQTDITERKDLEDRSRQAHKMAALGFLAGGIAHDFNNLLTAILGYCDILLPGELPHEIRRGLEKIKVAGNRGAALTSQLLAFCRKQLPKPQPLDMRSVLADLDSLLRRLIGEHIALTTAVQPALGMVTLVPGQLEQILLNLVVNARDAMPEGGAIAIEMANADPDPRRVHDPEAIRPFPYVMLAVADSGCGMSEEVLAALFRPLFTTKAAGQGTGLGLFTVHEIVRQNGGVIGVTSQLGRGTRIEIFLPRSDDHQDESPTSPHWIEREHSSLIAAGEGKGT
jgi:PAS domain S-box-containing protein